MSITEFKGKNRFLSNFYLSNIHYQGVDWLSVEHAYQAAKTHKGEEKVHIMLAPSCVAAKRLGKKVTLRMDWDSIKLSVMEEILRIKFSDPELRDKLMRTAPQQLIEGNWWGDRYWGACWNDSRDAAPGLWVGENHLGKLLMKIRDEKENQYLGKPLCQ